MQFRLALITDAQAFELMQPGQGAFHHPAGDAQATAMRHAPPPQDRLDAQTPQLLAVPVGIVGPVTLDPLGAAARPADLAPYRRDGFQQRQQLRNIVGIGAGERASQRNAAGIG